MSMSVFGQKIDNFKRIEIDGYFTNPLFSPTGTHVLLTGEHLKGVYLLDLKDNSVKEVSNVPGSGYAYSWDASGNSFYYREKPEKGYFTESKVVNYDIRDHYSRYVNTIDHNYLPSYKGEKDSPVVVYTNIATLKIEAKNLATSEKWEVTQDEGQFYNALLSPDGTQVAVHNGADIYMYSIKGSKGRKIGRGIATAWTEDGKNLVGFLDESEDGHNVSNSELYLFNLKDGKTKRLTNTEVILEMYPTVYKDKVIFADDRTGRIFITTLK